MIEREIQTVERDGRALEVERTGPADGPVVLVHTGTPSAGQSFAGWTRAGAERGLRHVAYSRPGYAGSTRSAGRSVADCAADVAAIADELGIERFYNVGWSGGGPHALACAQLLSERVISTAVLAGAAPRGAAELDWLAGMGEDNVAEFGATRDGPEALERFLEPLGAELANASGADVREAFGDLLSDVDREALTGEFAEHLAMAAAAGVANGIWGWFDDDVAFVNDWGFDPRQLAGTQGGVAIWQGRHDRMVPYSHGEWLAAHVGGAEPHLLEDEGHVTLVVHRYGDVLDAMLSRAAG